MNNPVLANTSNDEWSTPEEYIELARQVLGTINTDPASNEFAQLTVQADTFYTIDDNGLSKPWHGKVWLNPPYSRSKLKKFALKLLEEMEVGQCTGAIVLTLASTDTEWFHALADKASAICFTRGRVKFIRPDGSVGNSPTSGHVFFYFGDDVNSFRTVFSSIGLIQINAPTSTPP